MTTKRKIGILAVFTLFLVVLLQSASDVKLPHTIFGTNTPSPQEESMPTPPPILPESSQNAVAETPALTETTPATGTATLTLNVKTEFVKPGTKPPTTPPPQTQKPEVSKPVVTPTPTTSMNTTTPVVPPTPAPLPPPPQTPKPDPIPEPKPQERKALEWGVFAGSNPTAISDFEKRVSTNPDYLAYFIHWPNDKGQIRPWLKTVAGDKGRTLVIFWEASDHTVGGTDQPEFAYRRILEGDFDDYIQDFAEQVREYEDPVILIPFSELNGNWTPWSGTENGNTPGEAVIAYRYVHGFFKDVPNVKFGLALNAASVPDTSENALEAYYPGDAFVDYIGLDGFNMDWPWMSFNEIFAPGLKTISQYGKPMFIFSFGSAEGDEKAAWLKDAFYQMEQYPLMKGFIYFNQNKERNWLLWSDNQTFKVFNDYVSSL